MLLVAQFSIEDRQKNEASKEGNGKAQDSGRD